MDFSKIKKSLLQITKEMIPVILGIMIALWINNWQKDKEDNVFLSHVIQSIQKEHEENIMELKKIIPVHNRLADSIRFYMDDDELVIGDFLGMTNGFKVALIGNTSWKSFISNDFKMTDFDLIKNLSNIDEFKIAYNEQVKRLSDFIFKNIKSADQADKDIFLFVIQDLIYLEENLLEVHLEAGSALKNND